MSAQASTASRNPPAEPGTSKSSQLTRPFDGEASIGAKPATAGKGAGGGEVGIGRICAQCREGFGGERAGNSFGCQSRAYLGQRLTATMERLSPACGIGRVVEQTRSQIVFDKRFDQRFCLVKDLGVIAQTAAEAAQQNTSQVRGRTGISPQIGKGPIFEKPRVDFACVHLCRPTRSAIGYGPGVISCQQKGTGKADAARQRYMRGSA